MPLARVLRKLSIAKSPDREGQEYAGTSSAHQVNIRQVGTFFSAPAIFKAGTLRGMILVLAALALHSQAVSIDFYRGAPLATPRYWDVEDTYLDQADPDASNGGSYTLIGGKGKTILVRFGDLNRIVGANRNVVDASLLLSASSGEIPKLSSASRVLVPWIQGPRTAIGRLISTPAVGTKAPILNAANWRQREAGASWQSGGADGPSDSVKISGTDIRGVAGSVVISGLGGAVQEMLNHPAGNYGFALQFETGCEFSSSKAPTGRPILRIVTEEAAAVVGPDLSVVRIESSVALPKAGQDVTYTAHVKNVGDQPSKGFSSLWIFDGRPGNPSSAQGQLNPGEETTVTINRRFEGTSLDRRGPQVGLRIMPDGPDACSANNQLNISETAVPVDISVPSDLVARFTSKSNYLGSHSVEDWVQSQVAVWNDTLAAQSYFSFAPDGVLQRIRINSVNLGGSSGVPVDEGCDPGAADLTFLQSLSTAVGATDGHLMNVAPGMVQIPGSTTRSCTDLYPGIMGFGDTRFEGSVPGALGIEYQPVFDSTLTQVYLEPTDLFCATNVAELNGGLDGAHAETVGTVTKGRKAAILRVLDLEGRPIANTELLFYRSNKGYFPAGDPTFTLKTLANGIAILSGSSSSSFSDFGHDAGSGVYLVQAKQNGVIETGWLKAWELVDAAERGTPTSDIRLNLPDAPIDRSTDLAPDRIISDSASDAPATLAPLIDGVESTEASLPSEKDGWVEIDLGRDRTVGEIDLLSSGKPMWSQFDIMVYSTGQRPMEAFAWAHETNWPWTYQNRWDDSGNSGVRSVAYRAPYQRFRYIRLVNRGGGGGTLSEIKVYGASPPVGKG
jgi:hypothetical protein